MMKNSVIAVIMAIDTSPQPLHNCTFTGIGQNPITSFGGNGRKKWPRNSSARKKNARMKQTWHHRRKV